LTPRRDAPDLASLLETHRASLLRFVEREGSGLLKYEAADDLVQGVHVRAVAAADRFEYRSDREFLGWIQQVARQHIASRHEYWSALRRKAGKMLRLSFSGTGSAGSAGLEVAASATGASTVASRREQIAIAMRALAVLFPKDQEVVRWVVDDLPIAEMAERLGVSYEAAKKAKLRALERFRSTFELIVRRGGGRPQPRG